MHAGKTILIDRYSSAWWNRHSLSSTRLSNTIYYANITGESSV